MARKYLPFTIANNFKHNYVNHMVTDFETCYTSIDKTNVRVWSWGLYDYITGEYHDGNHIDTFFEKILNDKEIYDIGVHNLKFDGSFIIPWLFKHKYKFIPNNVFMEKWQNGDDMKGLFTHNITAMGQWFSITIAKQKHVNKSTPAFVHIWDTLKLFPKKLEEIGIQYNTGAQKIKEDRLFYEQIRPEGYIPNERERSYQKFDCLTIGQALKQQYLMYGKIYRTQASKAFTFFKNCCTDEAGNVNYKKKYEGMQQWKVPEIAGLEDYKGATVRYLPKAVRRKIDQSDAKLIDAHEYYIPDYFTWSDIKKAYGGGISFVNTFYQEKSIYRKVTVIDVNSMYPYCLRTFPIPYGKFIKVEGAPDFKKEGVWIAGARVSFKLKNEYNLPCIQIKEKYGRRWLKESTDYMKYGEMSKYNEDVIFFTSVDYETFKENYDFVVHKWLYHYYFPNCANKDGQSFVDLYYKKKQDAEKRMREVKKEDPENYKNNFKWIQASLDRQESKTALNSAYGKHGTKYFLYSKWSEFISDDEPIKYTPENKLSRDPEKDPSHYYCPYAAFVTSYARRMLVRTWNAFKGRALYCDTDSIHFLGTLKDIPAEIMKSIDINRTGALGLWKVENVFDKARYIRAKTYIECKKDGTCSVVCAGATEDIKKLMNWRTFKVGFNAWKTVDRLNKKIKDPEKKIKREDHSKLTPKQYPDGVALEYVNFEIKRQIIQ